MKNKELENLIKDIKAVSEEKSSSEYVEKLAKHLLDLGYAKEKKINLNDNVRVNLTNIGKMHLLEKHYKMCKDFNTYLTPPKIGEKGEYECHLHHLFQEFGDKIYMGCELPFNVIFEIIKE